jgi:DNA-binding transcriptional LysR family regulator
MHSLGLGTRVRSRHDCSRELRNCMAPIDWNDLRYFLAVHRSGTLALAARRLGINATTVGRRLTALEETTSARLFDRTPDGFRLTPAGHDLLPHAERMEAEALALERRVSGSDRRLEGVVKLSVTEMIGTRFVAPRVRRFQERHPGIILDLSCTNRPVSLGRREADIALRLLEPKEDNLVVKRLTAVDLALYASPRYLEKAGNPKRADSSLEGHRVILFADARAFAVENAWLVRRMDGARAVLRSDSVSSVYSAAAAGVGIALLPRVVADADPGLVRIDTRDAPEPRTIWQAVHRDLSRTPRIRAVLEFLAEVFAPVPTGARGRKR